MAIVFLGSYAAEMASDASTDLAVQRTFMAHERTLMAWIRTSVSLISFGFTIYKFFQYLMQTNPGVPRSQRFGPREFALSMIGIGIVALAFAAYDYRRTLKMLEQQYGVKRRSLAGALVTIILLMGLGFLVLVWLHE